MEKKVVALFVMCIVAVAAMKVCEAADQPTEEMFRSCFNSCLQECTADGRGSTFCEVKCDEDCGAKEAAAKLNIDLH